MKNKRPFLVILYSLLCLVAYSQEKQICDSALVSAKISKVAGVWVYSKGSSDSLIIYLAKVPAKKITPSVKLNCDMLAAWIYYKSDNKILINNIETCISGNFNLSQRSATGGYNDDKGQIAMFYTDKKLNHVCIINLVGLCDGELNWDIDYNSMYDKVSKKHYNFFYPEKLVLRRMKKNLL
jgi:hypothetical protein